MSETGPFKYKFCQRLGTNHLDLADYFDIQQSDRDRWETGRECWGILQWLEQRDRVDGLQEALEVIQRDDLIYLIQNFSSSHPLDQFFEVPPPPTAIQNSDPDEIIDFFRGYSESWTAVQSNIALPRRVKEQNGAYFGLTQLVEKLLADSTVKFLKIFGAGGSGRTTFARMLALALANHVASPTVLLRNLEQEQTPKNELKNLARKLSQENKKLFLLYDNPIRSTQVREILTLVRELGKINNTMVIVLEREDEWLAAYQREGGRSQRGEKNYVLEEQLNNQEIEQLCHTVTRLQSTVLANSKGILGENRHIDDFRQSLIVGKKDVLLVAMYEATTGEKIEETILNEFEGIPHADAQELYEFICGLTSYSLRFPYDLARVLYKQSLLKEIQTKYLAGIVRHRGGLLFPRHNTIAEIL